MSTFPGYVFFLIFLLAPHLVPGKTLPDDKLEVFVRLAGSSKGSQVNGISELKKYFQRFGYLSHHHHPTKALTDLYDEELESAVSLYQKNMGLSVTGKLDDDTINLITKPRCGYSDEFNDDHNLHVTRHYSYFEGKPRWRRPSPITLTYAFLPDHMIDYLSVKDIKPPFERAFGLWSSVIPVTFIWTDDTLHADIKIGFYFGDHGDEIPFDGPFGILGIAFPPEDGIIHLDGAETWSVDQYKVITGAISLEVVAAHEIGHVLGLEHSTNPKAVMFPHLLNRFAPRMELHADDVEGIQGLYGSNPNFKHSVPRDNSSRRSFDWGTFLGVMVLLICSSSFQ